MRLPNPSREARFSGANGDREYLIFSVQLADNEQEWQPCPVVMAIHINTALQTYCCSYTYMHVWSHIYSKSMDQPVKVANPARGQLNGENEHFPGVRVRA